MSLILTLLIVLYAGVAAFFITYTLPETDNKLFFIGVGLLWAPSLLWLMAMIQCSQTTRDEWENLKSNWRDRGE